MQKTFLFDLGHTVTAVITARMCWPSGMATPAELASRLGDIYKEHTAGGSNVPVLSEWLTMDRNLPYLPKIVLKSQVLSIDFLQLVYNPEALSLDKVQTDALLAAITEATAFTDTLEGQRLVDYLFER